MENNLLTAEEFMNSKQFEPDEGISFEEYHGDNAALVPTMMIEFAKIHVKLALEAAIEKGTATLHCRDYYDEHIVIDEQSILTAYPENLIR